MKGSTEERERQMVSQASENWTQFAMSVLEEGCESPIERLFVCGMLNDGWSPMSLHPHSRYTLSHIADHFRSALLDVRTGATCLLQFEGGGIRLDGLVLAPGRSVTFELDGHDFHERTKEQARRDKSRDRRLAAGGMLVVRFTGSEVFADPIGCAQELRRIAFAKVGS